MPMGEYGLEIYDQIYNQNNWYFRKLFRSFTQGDSLTAFQKCKSSCP